MKELLTPEETAKYLGIAVNTLAVWRTNRSYAIPYIKVGSRIRYDLEEVKKWLATRTNNKPLGE